jgi:Reverse transcriptase (RNA-dependent DNA polymerase)
MRDAEGRMYARKNKALYGSIDAAEMWYKNISTFLMSLGFEPNPYDQCVCNLWNKKTGKAMVRIALHVDDLLTTAKDKIFVKNLALSYQNNRKNKFSKCMWPYGRKHTHTQVKSPPSDPCAFYRT